jgi:hypothetical protein
LGVSSLDLGRLLKLLSASGPLSECPWMCRCAERKIALKRAASAAGRGDSGGASENIRFVARSLVEDAAFQARASLSLVRMTLGRGLRR